MGTGSLCRRFSIYHNVLKYLLPTFWYRFGACKRRASLDAYILICFGASKKTSISRCLPQKSAGVHGHASKLNSGLLADMAVMILRPHWARRAELTPVSSRRPALPRALTFSPLRPSSHTSVYPEVNSFRFFYCGAFGIVYNLQQAVR